MNMHSSVAAAAPRQARSRPGRASVASAPSRHSPPAGHGCSHSSPAPPGSRQRARRWASLLESPTISVCAGAVPSARQVSQQRQRVGLLARERIAAEDMARRSRPGPWAPAAAGRRQWACWSGTPAAAARTSCAAAPRRTPGIDGRMLAVDRQVVVLVTLPGSVVQRRRGAHLGQRARDQVFAALADGARDEGAASPAASPGRPAPR